LYWAGKKLGDGEKELKEESGDENS